MGESETGWTSEWYRLPNGVYWWRFDEKETPVAVRVFKSLVYGFVEDQGRWLNAYGGEFLGPISPSDAEQLSELRRAVTKLIEAAQFSLSTPGFIRGRDELRKYADATLAALNPPQEEKET